MLPVKWYAAHVRIPAPNCTRPCQAAMCEVAAKAHVVYLRPGQLCSNEVCVGHMAALQARGGVLVFPLDCLPPIEVLGRAVEVEIARRQAAAAAAQRQVFFNGGMYAGTGGNVSFTVTWV